MLSTTEAKIISLSAVDETVIPLMDMARELKENGYHILTTKPTVNCQMYEDNSDTMGLVTNFKYRP